MGCAAAGGRGRQGSGRARGRGLAAPMRGPDRSDGCVERSVAAGYGAGWWDRGTVLVCLATAIVLGATSMSDIALLAHQALAFADPPSESTVRRALAELDETALRRIAKAGAQVRARVWELLARRPHGFPWLCVAGKLLTRWVVIDMDATLITAHSDKQGAAATFKKGYGHHQLGAWCANNAECLAMLLRPGPARSRTRRRALRCPRPYGTRSTPATPGRSRSTLGCDGKECNAGGSVQPTRRRPITIGAPTIVGHDQRSPACSTPYVSRCWSAQSSFLPSAECHMDELP